MAEMFTGYAIEREDRELLYAGLLSAHDLLGDEPLPDEISQPWHNIENQASMNSCGGHAGSSAMECLLHRMTGRIVAFSRMWCYLTGQRRSGIRGDNGVTIQGLIKAMSTDGIVLEEQFPYPARYSPYLPPELVLPAKDRRVLGYAAVTDYDAAIRWIAHKGPIICGIPWKRSFAAERDGVIDDWSGSTLGGHAVYFAGYRRYQGEYQPELSNSHSSEWAKAGRAFVTRRAFEWMLNNGTFVGLSDLSLLPGEAAVDWTDPANSIF